MKRKLDNETIFHYDESTDRSVIETVSDVAPLLERNKREMNDHAGGYASETFNKVGSVDKVAYRAWCKKKGINSEEAWRNNEMLLAFLQDPENAMFRTHPTFFKKN
jgi:hypothetical protein